MNIDINISRAQVIAEVSKTTAYEGAHSGDFDNSFVKPEDKEMLDRYWIEACTLATETMKAYIINLTEPQPANLGDEYKATLSLPCSFNFYLSNTLTNAVYQHFCNYIIGKWFEMLGIEKSRIYLSYSTQNLEKAKSTMYQQTKILSVKPSTF